MKEEKRAMNSIYFVFIIWHGNGGGDFQANIRTGMTDGLILILLPTLKVNQSQNGLKEFLGESSAKSSNVKRT